MVAAYVADLEYLVSKSRLDSYRPRNGDNLQTATNYLWNIALSEALLQGIAATEVALRNAIHRAFTTHAGTEYWFWALLQPDDLDHVHREWKKLHGILKGAPSPGKFIAAQAMGFWPRLFENRYEAMWSQNKAALLWSVFPNHPKTRVQADWLTRKKVQHMTENLRDLRNRAMHHEPVFKGLLRPDRAQPGQPVPIVPLDQIHTQMCDLLSWIHPQLRLSLSFVDRFPHIFGNGWREIEAGLSHLIAPRGRGGDRHRPTQL